MANKQINQIFALLNKLGWQDKAIYSAKISKQTGGKYDTITALFGNADAANSFTTWLKNEAKKYDNMGKKVIYYLRLLGYITATGDNDNERIKKYIENIGTKNPDKKELWKLSFDEMMGVLKQVEARYKAFFKS